METTFSLIEDFLKNPRVEVSVSDSKEVLQLRQDLVSAKQEDARCQALYGREVVRCLKYEDYLRSIGINPAAIK
jgi:hypothetical protein